MAHTTTRMNQERLRAIQDRRRSNAAGNHGNKVERRARTRSASKSKAIAEFR